MLVNNNSLDVATAGNEPTDLSADALLQSLQVPSEAPAPTVEGDAPELIEGIPADQFFTALNAISGGVVGDRAAFTRVLEDVGHVPTLRTRVTELEGRSQISPFHGPLSERVDVMLRGGHAPQDIIKFIEMNSLDVTSLDPLDAVRRHYMLQKPGWSEDEINGLIETKLGIDLSADPTEQSGRQRAAIREAHEEAVTALRGQQVSAENPQAVEAARITQARAENIVGTWTTVVPQLATPQKREFAITDDTKTELNYQPSAAALQEAQAMVMMEIQNNPLAYPTNENMLKGIQDLYQRLAIMADLEGFQETVARHAYAKGIEFAMQKNSGNSAVLNRPNNAPQTVPAGKGIDYAKMIG